MYKTTIRPLPNGTFVALRESDSFVEIEPAEVGTDGEWTHRRSAIGRVTVTKPYEGFGHPKPASVSTSSTGDMTAADVITFVAILSIANEMAHAFNAPAIVLVDEA